MSTAVFKHFGKFLAICAAAVTFASATPAAFAAVDWSTGTVTAVGMGMAPPNAVNATHANMLARRAAIVDGYRQLVETVKGVQVTSESTVEQLMLTSDVVKTCVSASIQGARVVDEQALPGNGYQVTLSIPMFGAGGDSLATAVLPRVNKQPFATPQGAPAALPQSTLSAPSAPVVPTAATPTAYSVVPVSAGCTGLVVDARGLGLKPVMSPVIKTDQGTPIYGHQNLDYDVVTSKGMAGYTKDPSSCARAGANPMTVRAVGVEGGNPVISAADADRVLTANGANHFLDATNVVFVLD